MNLSKKLNQTYKPGFTIVELIIVIVVVAVLAAVTIVSYNAIQGNARESKIKTDLGNIEKAVVVARENSKKTMREITGSGNTAGGCTTLANGTDLASLDRAHACWTRYRSALDKISELSGMDIRNIVDPWGRPYSIDENEGESGNCGQDSLAVFTYPFRGSARMPDNGIRVPHSGFSGC